MQASLTELPRRAAGRPRAHRIAQRSDRPYTRFERGGLWRFGRAERLFTPFRIH